MKALKRLNDALPALVITILLYGVLVELVGVWFVSDKLRYTTGLMIGIALAIYMAIHISIVIRDAIETGATDGHTRRQSAKSVFRYIVVAIVFFITAYFRLGNPVLTFIGVLGLKLCAYVQPFVQKHILHTTEERG